jgi:hypothetical protein
MLCCPFNIAQPNPKNAYQQLININQQQKKSNQTQITMRFRFISYMIKKKKSSLFVQVPILPIPFPTLLPSLPHFTLISLTRSLCCYLPSLVAAAFLCSPAWPNHFFSTQTNHQSYFVSFLLQEGFVTPTFSSSLS